MGQYHYLVNLDKGEYVHPHHMGHGLKAWEILMSIGTKEAMVLLTVAPEPRGGGDLNEGTMVGRWHGDRVLFVGDYAEDGDFEVPISLQDKGIGCSNIYDLCTEPEYREDPLDRPWFTDISTEVSEALEKEGLELSD